MKFNFFEKIKKIIQSIFYKQTPDELIEIEEDAIEIEEDETQWSEIFENSKEETNIDDTVIPEEKELYNSSRYDNIVVFLDPGHTKSTPGKCSPDGLLKEWKYSRLIVGKIGTELEKLGIKYWITHPEDDWVDKNHRTDSKDLVLRCQRINQKYSELRKQGKTVFMISVHVNAAGNGQWYNATGWEIYSTKGQNNSDKLAECIGESAKEILEPIGKKIRADYSDGDIDKESNFYIIKNSNCVCVLTENFFMDNKNDVDFLLSEDGKDFVTKIHIKGILKYIEKYC